MASNVRSSDEERHQMIIKGGCHCGAIQYRAEAAPGENENPTPRLVVSPAQQKHPQRGKRPNQNKWPGAFCHCSECRRAVGALCAQWANIPASRITITKKGPIGRYRTTNIATREFCQSCGTSLFLLMDDEPEIVNVSVASIQNPDVFDFIELRYHIWVQDALDLVLDEDGKGGGLSAIIKDGLPRFKRGSAGERL